MSGIWAYLGTGQTSGPAAARDLARRGAIWVPGNLLPRGDHPGPEPGDRILLFWRDAREDPVGRLLGWGVVDQPERTWGGRRWLDTVPAGSDLFRLAEELGYGGPPNYRTMARIRDWSESPVAPGGLGTLRPGQAYRGLPAGRFLVPGDALDLTEVVVAPPDLLDRIVVDPRILAGKPIVRGLRIGVDHVLGWIETGSSPEDILREYPELEPEDIRACLAYARLLIENERVDPAIGSG